MTNKDWSNTNRPLTI